MGWSFNCVDYGRKAFIESLTGQSHFSDTYKPIAHRVVSNHVWQVVEHLPTGKRYICLDLIAKERNGGWGYKGLSEDMGPYHYDCPLSLLAMCTEPLNDNAKAWREKVQEYHAKRKALSAAKPKPGLVVTYGGEEYTLVEPWGARKGWKVMAKYGGHYRMKAHQLASALKAMCQKESVNDEVREPA